MNGNMRWTCRWCGSHDEQEADVQGFWCEACESVTVIPEEARPLFTLWLEKGHSPSMCRELDTYRQTKKGALPCFSQRLSPLRYPGGKGRVIGQLAQYVRSGFSQTLYSPFAGGAAFEWALLKKGQVERLVLNDYDYGIYGLWWTIQHMPWDLIERIRHTVITHQLFFECREAIRQDYQGLTPLEAAWALLVVNRCAYSGIVKANPLGGRTGSAEQLRMRWNPATLIQRIQTLHEWRDRIEVTQMDAVDFIETYWWQSNKGVFFVDPPYVEKGSHLYRHAYTERQHIQLATLLDALHRQYPLHDILLTYDDHPFIDALYETPSFRMRVERSYSC